MEDKRAGFHLVFTWEKLALLLGLARLAESHALTKFIFPRNPESNSQKLIIRRLVECGKVAIESERLSQSERTISPEVTCAI